MGYLGLHKADSLQPELSLQVGGVCLQYRPGIKTVLDKREYVRLGHSHFSYDVEASWSEKVNLLIAEIQRLGIEIFGIQKGRENPSGKNLYGCRR